MPTDKYPIDSFVYYRDNYGDMIIARVGWRSNDGRFLRVKPGWYAAEPVVSLPLRRIEHDYPASHYIPVSIVERTQPHAPYQAA
jgi:hypothetical protein